MVDTWICGSAPSGRSGSIRVRVRRGRRYTTIALSDRPEVVSGWHGKDGVAGYWAIHSTRETSTPCKVEEEVRRYLGAPKCEINRTCPVRTSLAKEGCRDEEEVRGAPKLHPSENRGIRGQSRLVARMAAIFRPTRGSAWQVCVYVEAGRWPFEVAM
jgi:hypothetical protein